MTQKIIKISFEKFPSGCKKTLTKFSLSHNIVPIDFMMAYRETFNHKPQATFSKGDTENENFYGEI